MIKPRQIILFFLSVFILLFGLVLIIPAGEIYLLPNLKVRIPSNADLFGLSQEPKTNRKAEELAKQVPPDTVLHIMQQMQDEQFLAMLEREAVARQRIEYARRDSNELEPFFMALDSLARQKDILRILHYGDSQIEGDRSTNYLRKKFQQYFGGRGPGMLPVVSYLNYYVNAAIRKNNSGNWYRKTAGLSTNLPHRKFGPLLSYSQYYPGDHHSGWVNIIKNPEAPAPERNYEQVTLFFGNTRAAGKLVYSEDGLNVSEKSFSAGEPYLHMSFKADTHARHARLTIYSAHSPDIYGIALDGENGVAVDNIALRGSAGLNYTYAERDYYTMSLDSSNTGLIIMQFGINVAPFITRNYDFYRDGLIKQIELIKSRNPGIPVLLVGISDMARRSGTGMASYPNIETIRDAQRDAAFATGAAFWDSYMAMGGKNSMVTWVHSNPPLGQKDYTHMTNEGARLMGQMLWEAIISEYVAYKKMKDYDNLF